MWHSERQLLSWWYTKRQLLTLMQTGTRHGHSGDVKSLLVDLEAVTVRSHTLKVESLAADRAVWALRLLLLCMMIRSGLL